MLKENRSVHQSYLSTSSKAKFSCARNQLGGVVQRHDMEIAHRKNSEKGKQHIGLSATQFKSLR